MTKKFLLISQVFYPDQVSTANLFTDLCSVLAEDGIEVEVWSAHPSYTELKRQPGKMEYKGIKIHVLPSTNFHKSNLAGKILNMLTFTLSAGLKVLFSKDRTPVWTHTTPPVTGIILAFICMVKRRKFVYILLDIFPEGLIRLGRVSGKNPFIRLWHLLFIRSLKRSKKIIVIGRDIKHWIDKICPGNQEKTEYIPHWQDDTLLFPIEIEQNRFIMENELTDKFVVQYSGNMGLWNEMRTIGKAVKKNIENVTFIFVGGGIRKKELTDEFISEKQQNVIMLPFRSGEDFNNMMNASHAHIVTLREGLEGIAVPCKIYGILAVGRPVIAMVPEESEIAYTVREENCGFVINPTDVDGLIKAIVLLKSDEILAKQLGQNSRMAFEKKYTARVVAERYKTVLNQRTDQ
jgi:colanic acid biosynthesis glycosyl transferase WcaI